MCSSQMATQPKLLTKLSMIHGSLNSRKNSWKQLKKMETIKNDQYFNVLHAPYIQGFSEKLQKDLRKLGIGFVMKKGETLKTKLCKLKPKTEKEDKKDVDYIISCQTCGMKYIGETSQQFKNRKYQHQKDVENKNKNNGIYCPMKENKNIRLPGKK